MQRMSLNMEDYSDKTDEELLREYRLGGNPSYLNVLFSRHADVGFRTAMRYMRNQPDAEDVLQLAFIQFLENLPNFREGSSTVKPWLMKMIVNASLGKLREEKRRSQRQQVVASEKFQKHEQDGSSKSTSTDREELKNKIKNVVDTLPEKYRSPIWLVLYEGFSYPEVATVLALPEKTVRTQVARGLEKLKELMGTFGSVLSVSLITELIAESNLEVAPVAIKKIIDSPDLYKSASVNTSNSATGYSFSKVNFLFSFQFLSILVLTSIGIFTSIFLLKNKETTTVNPDNKTQVLKSKAETLAPKDTNLTWNFINENERNIPLIVGNWEWSEKTKFMAPSINEHVIFSLPIIPQEKCFVVENLVVSLATKERQNLTLNLLSFWAKDLNVLAHENISLSKKYLLTGLKPVIVKSYFYKNYICSFANNQFVGARRYSEDLTGAKVALLARNYAIQKISSQTLDAPPAELLKAMEEVSAQKWNIQNSWQANTTQIQFNDPQ